MFTCHCPLAHFIYMLQFIIHPSRQSLLPAIPRSGQLGNSRTIKLCSNIYRIGWSRDQNNHPMQLTEQTRWPQNELPFDVAHRLSPISSAYIIALLVLRSPLRRVTWADESARTTQKYTIQMERSIGSDVTNWLTECILVFFYSPICSFVWYPDEFR